MTEEDYEYREKNGIRWKMTEHTALGTRETSGFTIDNLDSKRIEEAKTMFEELFIVIRNTLEKNESKCMDVESERLQICQDLAADLHRRYKFGAKA